MASYVVSRSMARRRRVQEESVARITRIHFDVIVRGLGEVRITGDDALHFGTAMLEEPHFTFGLVAISEIKGIYRDMIPRPAACVLGWVQNDLNLWTGAEVGLGLDSFDPRIVCKFNLVFEGWALRTTHKVGTGD